MIKKEIAEIAEMYNIPMCEMQESYPLKKQKRVIIDFGLNKLDDHWWIDLGISYQPETFCKPKRLICVSLIFVSLYIRF
jgi:hypothetical protein